MQNDNKETRIDTKAIKEKIIAAFWDNPERLLTNCTFKELNATKKVSKTDPFGNVGKDKTNFAIYRSGGGNYFANGGGKFNLFAHVQETENKTFFEALKALCDLYNIPFEMSETEKRAVKYRAFNDVIIDICHKHILEDTDEAIAARNYLKKRGLNPSERIGLFNERIKGEICAALQKQFAADDPDGIKQRVAKLFPYNANDYNIIIARYNGGVLYDFCGRLTNPQPNETRGKYIYSSHTETDGTTDGQTPTGAFIRTNKQQIIVEGILDLETLLQNNVQNAAAICTSTLSEKLLSTLNDRGVTEIILIPDQETHGKPNPEHPNDAVKLDGLGIELNQVRGEQRFIFTVRGIDEVIKYNHRNGANIKISISNLLNYSRDPFGNDTDPKDINDYILLKPESTDLQNEIIRRGNLTPWYFYLLDTAAKTIEDPENLADTAQKIYLGITDQTARNRFKIELQKRFRAIDKTTIGNDYQTAEPWTRLYMSGINERTFIKIDTDGEIDRKKRKLTELSDDIKEAANDPKNALKIRTIGERLKAIEKNADVETIIGQLDQNIFDTETEIIAKDTDILTPWDLYEEEANGIIQPTRKISFSSCGVSVICAPCKHGKTLFLLNTALQLAKQSNGKKYLYFSMEEDRAQIALKFYRYFAKGVIYTNGNGILDTLRDTIKTDEATADQNPQLNQVRADVSNVFKNLKIARLTTREIEAAAEQIRAAVNYYEDHGETIGAVFIDYLQLFRHTDGKTSRTDELSFVCDTLNDLSKELNKGIITAAQFNREVKGTKTKVDEIGIAQIGESQSIENIATDIYLLLKPTAIKEKINQELKAVTIGPRAARLGTCFNSGKESLYIENLISREHKGGGYCVINTDFNFGILDDGSSAADVRDILKIDEYGKPNDKENNGFNW